MSYEEIIEEWVEIIPRDRRKRGILWNINEGGGEVRKEKFGEREEGQESKQKNEDGRRRRETKIK